MLEFLPSADDVIGIRIGGHISQSEIDQLLDRVEEALEANEKTHLYIEAESYDGFDKAGFAQQMSRSWRMISKLDRFGRVAVVSDTSWIRWAARIESALLPGISYETFTMEERDQALAWVKGEEELPHRPAFKIIETDNPDVLGFELCGKISAEQLDAIAEHFNERLEHGHPKRLLGRFSQYRGFSLTGIMDEDFWAMKRDMIRTLSRYAIVGAPHWMEKMIQALDPLFRVQIRSFSSDKEDEAWAWLEAKPKTDP